MLQEAWSEGVEVVGWGSAEVSEDSVSFIVGFLE